MPCQPVDRIEGVGGGAGAPQVYSAPKLVVVVELADSMSANIQTYSSTNNYR